MTGLRDVLISKTKDQTGFWNELDVASFIFPLVSFFVICHHYDPRRLDTLFEVNRLFLVEGGTV